MNRFLNLLYMVLISALIFGLASCEDDDDDDDMPAQEVMLTQAMLDASSSLISADLTGGGMAHNGNANQTGDDTYRDVYTSMADASAEAMPGDVITKLTFGKDTDGNKEMYAQVGFAMVKQEEGYNSEDGLGDWTWYMIPLDGTTNSLTVDGANKVDDPAMCATCHSGGSSDYRFVFPG